mgnify:CR=1 FL=1
MREERRAGAVGHDDLDVALVVDARAHDVARPRARPGGAAPAPRGRSERATPTGEPAVADNEKNKATRPASLKHH